MIDNGRTNWDDELEAAQLAAEERTLANRQASDDLAARQALAGCKVRQYNGLTCNRITEQVLDVDGELRGFCKRHLAYGLELAGGAL